MVGQETELLAVQGTGDEMNAYERLIGDAMKGDATLFEREDAVEAAWRIVAPVLSSVAPPHQYEKGTWGPSEAERFLDESRRWHQPQVTCPTSPEATVA